MKKIVLIISLLTLVQIGFSQSSSQIPTGFQYQAVIRDDSGDALSKQDVTIRFSLLQGSASGSSVYAETQEVSTNAFGLISLSIGQGEIVSGNLSTVNWSLGSYFLQTEVDFGSGFDDFGTHELLSVPYALYGEDADADATNEIQDISLDGTSLTISGGSTVDLGVLEANTDEQDLADVLGQGADANSLVIFNLADPTNAQDAATKSYVDANDKGAFSNESNVISAGDSDDDFVFGSDQLVDDNSSSEDDSRMLFDKSKGAFRAGNVNADQWDETNIGNYSTALGISVLASGYSSVAIGNDNIATLSGAVAIGTGLTASQDYAVAIGQYNEASGLNSTAFGINTSASGSNSTTMGNSTIARGDSELAIGSFNTDYTPAGDDTDRIFVVGNGTESGSESDAFTIYKNGNALLDGTLFVNEPTDDTHAATKKYVDDNDEVGAFTNTSNVISAGDDDDDFVFGASDLYNDGTRMFFDRSGGAFRAGVTSESEWEEASVAQWSFASGYKTTASGIGSVALGHSTTATDLAATATGRLTVAAGRNSFAAGIGTTAGSYAETAIGSYNTTYSVTNSQNFNSADRLFVIGNGSSSVASDAMIVHKTGDVIINGNLSIDEPTVDEHAATKAYVDNSMASLNDFDEVGNIDFEVLVQGETKDVDYSFASVSKSTKESRVGQSFKAQISGKITRVVYRMIFSSTTGNEFVLYDGTGFGGSELARIPFTPGGTSIQNVDITFSEDIELVADQSYTVAVEGTDVECVLTNDNPYSAGTAYWGSSNGGGTWDSYQLTTYMLDRITPQTAISANETSVGVWTDAPDASAALEVSSTSGGLLMPRMTTTERDAISSPADGLMIYNTTTTTFQGRAGGAWVDLN
ncbi:Head domain of trimeric autotransporter adhesin [Reichenbachiella faecimaris]|uniref:Head domain of trimeric autotransporter adhesin n=1 Tax=Reichenbachiella faecimaris TaxID=692418 RepID=A0A1W2G5A1_REIFA|nr:hypothetical protein [Reichenbachiella faecimaris]SMD31859.1 Head domain of trimeric autotransporter adhesin [Reichenbachiella faecimaris]